MKRILASGLFFILFFSVLKAQQNPQILFDEANTLIEDNNFYDAMSSYRAIENSGMDSGALFLNMGIAATQIDSLGLAKYYFLKATQFETTSDLAIEALQYVESQFSRQSATLPKLPWDKAVDWLKDGPGVTTMFFAGFVFIIIAVFFVLSKWFELFSFKKIATTVSSLAILGILILLLSFYVDYVDGRYSEAVIIISEVQVKQSSNETSDLVSLAYEGYSVTVDLSRSNFENNWLYIRLGNGQFGWIENNGIKIL